MITSEKEQIPILLVDDDPLVLASLKHILDRAGYEVLTAKDGPEALEVLSNFTVGVILCDQNMPGVTGIDILKEALEVQPHASRILLTAFTEMNVVLDAINVGQASQFIQKPWDNDTLLRVIAIAMERYRLTKENVELHKLILAQHQVLAKNHKILKHDLQLGARIHETLLLGKIPTEVPGFVIKTISIASHDIDGDFFEFYQPVPEILDFVVGDVMGKGIPAALIGMALKNQFIRFAIPFTYTETIKKHGFWEEDLLKPHEILSLVHHELASPLMLLEYFASLFYGRFNLKTRTFQYVDCGFMKPIHYRANEKKCELLSGNNFPLGSVEENDYQYKETNYELGDFFIFYSDGISEAISPQNEPFGVDRLIQIAEKHPEAEPATMLNLIKHALMSFAQRETFDDDITVIVIKILHYESTTPTNQNKLKFRSDFSQLQNLRDFIERLCSQAPGDTERLTIQLQLAINELFCNIVQHGYKGKEDGIILIEAKLEPEGIMIEMADQGDIFDPHQMTEPSLAGDKSSGFGWYITRQIADYVTYMPKKSKEGWNHLHFFKTYIEKGKKMQFSQTILNNVSVITLEGNSLDAKDAPELKEKIAALISSQNIQQMVFDLSQVNFIDSSGLGVFLSILRLLNSRNGELKLASLNKAVRTLFELVSMHKIFEIYNTTDEAVQSFTK